MKNLAKISFLLFTFLYNNISFAKIDEKQNVYIVSEVKVHSELSSRSEAEEELFVKAKLVAFSYIKIYTNSNDISATDIEIDEMMLEFSPKKMIKENGMYTGIFEIIFDKAKMENFITSKKAKENNQTSKNDLEFNISIDKDLSLWVATKKTMSERKIDFSIYSIQFNKISFLVKNVNEETMEKILLEKGIIIVNNNKKMFIKKIEDGYTY